MDQKQQLHQFAATHLLQHTLRSLCTTTNSQWVYAVFWRILPRNYPPPKWDLPRSIYDRSRSNRRNWILAWEDGFCNFAASCGEKPSSSSSTAAAAASDKSEIRGLQPDIFFKMSHEIYNFDEGLIGKVAADHSHKWIFKEPRDQEANPWQNPSDSHPRTWEAQFQSGIETIALIAVREGVVQLGAVNKVNEDLNYVVLLRKKFSYLESIPGVFLPHPSTAAAASASAMENWAYPHHPMQPLDPFDQLSPPGRTIMPSMNSLEVLLSKLPAVVPPIPPPSGSSSRFYGVPTTVGETMVVAKEETREEEGYRDGSGGDSGNISLDMHDANYYGSYLSKTSEGF